MRFGQTIVAKEKFCYAEKPIRDADVGNKVISKLVQIKANSKYLIRYLDKVIKSLVFTWLGIT